MSRNEWERGTIKLPSGYAPKLRAALNEAVDREVAALATTGDAIWAKLMKIPAAKRRQMNYFALSQQMISTVYVGGQRVGEERSNWIMAHFVHQRWTAERTTVLEFDKPTAAKIKKRLVRRKTLRSETANVPVTVYSAGWEATITLDRNEVHWEVPENNHAVESARESVLGKALFEFLDTVEWTTRSGGELVGNDESNEESGREYAGAGGSYVTETYSKAAQKEKREWQARQRSTGYPRWY